MQNDARAFRGILALLTLLRVLASPDVFSAASFFALRGFMVQHSGVLAIGCMSIAMMLSLRPRWPERRLDGLDRMYRLHKWLGIGALVLATTHWLWAKGPKWAVGWGLLGRPERGARPPVDNPVEAFLLGFRGTAEGLGEWAFYGVVALILVALATRIPWRWFRLFQMR